MWPVEWEIKGEKERDRRQKEREKEESERIIRHVQRRGIDS